MRVGLDLLYLLPGTVGGTETYAAGLIPALARQSQDTEFVVFVNQESSGWPLPEGQNFRRVVCGVNARSRARRYWYQHLVLRRLLREWGLDVIHSLGYVAPMFAQCPSVVTVPDCNFHALRDQMPWTRRSLLGFFVGQSVRRASRVITISHFSSSQIQAVLGVPESKIVVTPLASRFASRHPSHETGLPWDERPAWSSGPYILAFSSTSPHKNIDRLVSAFLKAKQNAGFPHRLVLVGHLPPRLLLNLRDMETDGTVVAPGYVSDTDLAATMAGAQALVFPSLYEGFGLPALDAMALGIPVISTNRASLPEVCGDGALMIDPMSIDDMAEKIELVATRPNLREDLTQRGLRNAQRFSWEKTAEITLRVYEEVHANAKGNGAKAQ